MSDVESLVRQVLVESGYPPVDLQRTPWAVAKDVAQGIVDGTLPIGTGADFLILELGDRWSTPPEIWKLIFLIDDWEDLRGTPPTDDELRELAGKIVDFARAVLEVEAEPGS
ncbi:hypothetical protein AB0B56_14485 [Streptosporangium canum]|uniref:hypothetical protein n=1 Tax=Streptosporangium canum TaxID=324952 RepID=UPI0034418293